MTDVLCGVCVLTDRHAWNVKAGRVYTGKGTAVGGQSTWRQGGVIAGTIKKSRSPPEKSPASEPGVIGLPLLGEMV